MRIPALLAAAALALACGTDSPAPPPVAAGWSLLSGSPLAGEGKHHMDAWFLSADTGFMVDIDGKLWRTQDGGATWELRNVTTSVLMRAVAFVSPTHGFIGNLNSTGGVPTPDYALFETTDGGATIHNITSRISGPIPVGVCGMWALDDSTVFAVGRWSGPAVFLRTRDAGATWTSRSLAPLVTGIIDVRFTDAMHGIIVGGDGVGITDSAQATSHTVILGTTDGGDSWHVLFRSSEPGTWAWKISFPSDSVGYVGEQGPNPAGYVVKTTDGGATWVEYITGTPGDFEGIGFAAENVGWVANDSATYETDDGALSWYRVNLGADHAVEDVNRFRMLPGATGYALGKRVYKYSGLLSARRAR
ncbi:MAG TPA: hypothetical protein VMT93_03175 [Gemmatimonadaceae bacterium]|nr:hypothetical protein [Gemmatimonadaceae bacterium]